MNILKLWNNMRMNIRFFHFWVNAPCRSNTIISTTVRPLPSGGREWGECIFFIHIDLRESYSVCGSQRSRACQLHGWTDSLSHGNTALPPCSQEQSSLCEETKNTWLWMWEILMVRMQRNTAPNHKPII